MLLHGYHTFQPPCFATNFEPLSGYCFLPYLCLARLESLGITFTCQLDLAFTVTAVLVLVLTLAV